MAVFALVGGAILRFFGITTPAFQIAGGIIFWEVYVKTLKRPLILVHSISKTLAVLTSTPSKSRGTSIV